MRKLNLQELESDFPVLDYENQKCLKGGLSVLDVLEAINRGETWLENCTFNFDNGICTSVLFNGNYIDLREASAKDMLGGDSGGGGGGDDGNTIGVGDGYRNGEGEGYGDGIGDDANCIAFSYLAPEIVVNSTRFPNYLNGNNEFITSSWDRLISNPFVDFRSGDSGYGGGSYVSGNNMNTALAYIQSIVDEHTPYRKEYGKLRTANTPEGLAYMDCSELVCRYFAKMGFISENVKAMNSLGIRKYAENHPDMLPRLADDAFPQAGDIFLWHRSDTDGHTGIVKSYDPSTRMVTILEEYSWGNVREAREIQYQMNSGALTRHDGWEGFYRPNVD